MTTPVRQPRSLTGPARSRPRVMARPAGGAGRSGGAGRRAGTGTTGRAGRAPGSRRSTGSTRRLLPLAGVLLGLLVLGAWWALPAFSAPPEPSPSPIAGAPANGPAELRGGSPPERAASPGVGSLRPPPSPPARAPAPSPSPAGSSPPMPTPAASHGPAASLSAREFARRGQVVEIGFPFKPSTRYRYRDNWGDLRLGSAEHYNHAHSRRDGQLRRAHDGIDLYARRGEPVLAPFDGLVVKPAELWQPWHPERYGRTAVIVSAEPTSEGYISLLTHLDRLWVKPGQEVRRGEVIGTVGSTGNAEGGPAHLHFELRAPFPLAWREVGQERLVDAFNPYPSLANADPRRQD